MVKNMKQNEEQKKFEKQSERLKDVLKVFNLKQVDVVRELEDKFSISTERMSNFVNGKRPITEDVLKGLNLLFFINPDYISGKSDYMYDIPERVLKSVFSMISDIVITENPSRKSIDAKENKSNEKYLHITMDKNYYDYFIKLDSIKIAEESNSAINYEKIRQDINVLYNNDKPEYEEYVLLPKNTLFEIIKGEEERRKNFPVIVDTELVSGILNECNPKSIRPSR